jgi:dephospho-CoA kinase
MKIIGITGGVGCGKSTVLQLLKKHTNSYIIMADDVAKGLYKSGSALVNAIEAEFGSGCISADGSVDTKSLARVIFSDEAKREKLNGMVHPMVKREILDTIERLRKENSYEYVFVEAALLLEAEYDKFCDEVWYVTADEKTRRQRLKTDRGYSDEKIDSMLATQLSEDEFKKKCSRIIDNSGSIENTECYLVKMLNL